nr:hypothetical protein [uncultured Draconibacterium sp.]
MKNEKINTEIQNVNVEKNTANEKWETPEMLVFSVGETKNGIFGPSDGSSYS